MGIVSFRLRLWMVINLIHYLVNFIEDNTFLSIMVAADCHFTRSLQYVVSVPASLFTLQFC
jgi:hypothetical protein